MLANLTLVSDRTSKHEARRGNMDDLTCERAVLAPQQINLGISDIGLRGFQFAPAAARSSSAGGRAGWGFLLSPLIDQPAARSCAEAMRYSDGLPSCRSSSTA